MTTHHDFDTYETKDWPCRECGAPLDTYSDHDYCGPTCREDAETTEVARGVYLWREANAVGTTWHWKPDRTDAIEPFEEVEPGDTWLMEQALRGVKAAPLEDAAQRALGLLNTGDPRCVRLARDILKEALAED